MNIDPTYARQLEALLEFQIESGVDCLIGDEPLDWVARSVELAAAQRQARAQHAAAGPDAASQMMPRSGAGPMGQGVPQQGGPSPFPAQVGAAPVATPPPPTGSPAAGAAPAVPTAQTVQEARDLAASARTLDELRDRLAQFNGCILSLTAKTLVFADGNPEARVMFVGEAPGRHEDQQGKPFVGQDGQLLDRMLKAIGLDRSSAYIANVVPWRPPGDRTPTPQETDICKPFIVRQIELAAPDVLVFLGAAAAKSLMGSTDSIRRLRGRWMKYPSGGREIACLATYHPAYLLRSPLEKRLSWQDFLAINHKLQETIK